MTNAEKLRAMSDEQLAAEFMIFRPSDACFEDENRDYYALDNTWHKHSQDCFAANLKWLKKREKKHMRLIDIDELWDAVADNWSGIGVCSVKDILEFIESMPTIYPEPVKHGRWKYDPDYGEYRCTFCNDWGAHEDERTHYCPNCGAKMEEERGGIYETD